MTHVFNLTGGEIFILLLIGLVVLGPEKLPDALRTVGRFYNEVRRVATGIQSDVTKTFSEPLDELKKTANDARRLFIDDIPESQPSVEPNFIPYEADETPESSREEARDEDS